MPLLEVRDLEAGYGPIRALDHVSLDVEDGELVALIGANGAGKTTLLMAISGVVPSRGGSIRFAGSPLTAVKPHEVMRLGIGHAPEGRRIFPRLTVRENLELGGFTQTDRAKLSRDIDEVCGLFPVLGERMDQLGGTLSGGQRQRLAIARALVRKPKLLIFDEATSALDNLTQAVVTQSLEKLMVTRVVIAHRLSTIKNADKIVVIQKGQVVETGVYKTLMDAGGVFFQLMNRQLL